jgi:hypothetical protein
MSASSPQPWSGVNFTEEVLEQQADASETARSLEEESRRLREELEELKRRQV